MLTEGLAQMPTFPETEALISLTTANLLVPTKDPKMFARYSILHSGAIEQHCCLSPEKQVPGKVSNEQKPQNFRFGLEQWGPVPVFSWAQMVLRLYLLKLFSNFIWQRCIIH